MVFEIAVVIEPAVYFGGYGTGAAASVPAMLQEDCHHIFGFFVGSVGGYPGVGLLEVCQIFLFDIIFIFCHNDRGISH